MLIHPPGRSGHQDESERHQGREDRLRDERGPDLAPPPRVPLIDHDLEHAYRETHPEGPLPDRPLTQRAEPEPPTAHGYPFTLPTGNPRANSSGFAGSKTAPSKNFSGSMLGPPCLYPISFIASS